MKVTATIKPMAEKEWLVIIEENGLVITYGEYVGKNDSVKRSVERTYAKIGRDVEWEGNDAD